uniref:Uncharacterized protein n=1 Tax=Tanacetum cinerariifolium TaxID=118510 RepID=A0A699HGC5_TANCI|nr:hypothetical protein [Tanacetum cinerariifolium]
MKDQLCDGGWIFYVPNHEWILLEFKRKNLIHAKRDCIGEYGLLIDDNDFECMCDYLLYKDKPLTVSNEEGRLEVKKCKLLERHANELLRCNMNSTIAKELKGILKIQSKVGSRLIDMAYSLKEYSVFDL